ncbi:DUF5134 domain-containing protein [Streptomyces corynorhini]|uniref:DUF5134 domain-containing protein n=1 Tax=Streptomyces corynorhini TaxID=2282652 RepID=A0A370AVS6_9ACTN|nr:DUF5134 domain-containing protein [Streptomyces corynorhini]RDG33441.1 DUF5134 domain-containing protein [Streptomyces corynorhini]
MHGPAAVGWLLVALCAVSGGLCLLRTRSAVAEQRGSAGGEALMGFGMAAMAVPAAVLAPPRWVWLGYVAVFGAAALHALVSEHSGERRHRHRSHHLLGMLAMVYMAGAMAGAPSGAHASHAAGGAGGAPLVTGVLLIYFTGYVLWAGGRLVPLPAEAAGASGARGATAAAGWGDRPELAFACRLSMGVAMLAMLLTI